MKLLLSAEEHGIALEEYMSSNHNIQMRLGQTLGPIELDFDATALSGVAIPAVPKVAVKPKVLDVLEAEVDEAESNLAGADSDRELAILRAEELGITFRSDIKTDTLIKRIEEREEEIAIQIETAQRPEEVDLDSEDDLAQEIPEEEEEVKPKKPSMFTVKRAQETEGSDEEAEEEEPVVKPKKKGSFFDKLNKPS